MAGPPLHDRLYRALLKLFPREFRGDFGDQMADDFNDQREDAARAGGPRRVRMLWLRTFVDALRRAPREHLDILRRDAGYALRLFRRRPGMTASALLTLTIGIGLTAAVFSVAYGVLWQPLALPDSERLVYLTDTGPPPARQDRWVSQASVDAWQREARSLSAVASIRSLQATLAGDGGAEAIVGGAVSRNFFSIVGARAIHGRLFHEADFPLSAPAAGATRPAVIAYDLWQRAFGGEPDVIGRTVSLGRLGRAQIVGVLESEFVFPLRRTAAFWLPDAPDDNPYAPPMIAIGRLAPGASVASAQSELDLIASRLAAVHPESHGDRGARLLLLRERIAGATAPTQLWFLLGAAGCVLLIACATVSNLLLSHAAGRRRELATRVALGASRAHLVRQALTEGLVLALAGGGAGFLLAWWTVPALVALAPRTIPRLSEVSVSWQVLVFAAVASVCVGLVSSVAASLAASRTAPGITLRAQRAAGHDRGRFRQVLIVAQVAVALMLAVAAALLVQTMRAVTALPLGFDPSSAASISFNPGELGIEGVEVKATLERDLIAAIRDLDGVVAAGVGPAPLMASRFMADFALPSHPSEMVEINLVPVGPGYLEALGARVLEGRFFEETDTPGGDPVAIVSASAARQHWPSGAVGQWIRYRDRPVLIVGVLNDVRHLGLEAETAPTLYLPSAQTANYSANSLLVRTSGDPREMLPAIRAVARQVDERLPLGSVQTLDDRLDVALAPRRFNLWLVSLFSSIALVLAVVGIYGVLMESVAQRVPEIGVRMALGASAAGVMRMFLRQGGWMIAIGVALGTAAAFGLSGVMASFVFGVPPTDPVSFAVACLAVTMAGLLACAIPGSRASRVDPVIALRQE
jgi:putative ABC transport system permease protein